MNAERFFDVGPGAKATIIDELVVPFTHPRNIITLHPFTITSVNSTPTIQHVGDRPAVGLLSTTNAGTNGNNFQLGVASIRPQAGKEITWTWTMRSASFTNHEFACGLSVISTTITASINGGTEPTDWVGVYKDSAETRFTSKAVKNSVEETKLAAQMDALSNNVWYRGQCRLRVDPSTDGKGILDFYWGEDSLQAVPLVSTQHIAATLAQDESMAFFIGWLTGAAEQTQMNFGMFGYRIYA